MNANYFRRRTGPGLMIALVGCLSGAAAAQDFRVKTDVFAAGDRAPIAENLTLFTDAAVYDFSLNGGETTIFEPIVGRFVLLDPKRRLKTELPLPALGKFVADLQAEGVKNKDPNLFAPKFEVQYDGVGRKLELTSSAMIYKASGVLPGQDQRSAVKRFRQFTDWTARLNTTHSKSLPFGRMELNKELEKRGLVPEEIEVVYISRSDPTRRVTYRSRQAFTWELTGQDRRRLDEVREQRTRFKLVGWLEYRQ